MVEPLHNQAQLLQEIAQGNENAFRKMVLHYQDWIYSAGIRMTGSPQWAEDILQDTFLKVWLKKEHLPAIENFGGWLYRIVQHQILNALKRSASENRASSLLKSRVDKDLRLPSHALEQKELEKIIDTAVRRLPEKQMHTYLLIKVSGLTRDQVSAKLQVSPQTVKSNLDQAMRFIRAFCVKHMGEQDSVLYSILLFIYFF